MIELTEDRMVELFVEELGYDVENEHYKKVAKNLLEANDFDFDRFRKLMSHFEEMEEFSTSFISLAGESATIKIKMSDENDLYTLRDIICKVSINIG